MIVLDTNVLSELMRPAPEPRVVAWLSRQPRPSLFTTCLTEAEILYGIELLPASARRDALHEAARGLFEVDLRDHVLPFDRGAATSFATIAAHRRRVGRPISQIDAQIAAIAASRGAAVATRNVPDFSDCGVRIVDPWAE